MQEFIDFAKNLSVEVTATRIPTRTGDAWESRANVPDPVHFHVLLTATIGGKVRTLWSGEYSQGIGHAESWAKKHKSRFGLLSVGHGWSMRDALTNGAGRGRTFRHDSNYWEHVRAVYAKSNPLKPEDILQCLQMDIMGADQNFEDWAGDLGYSEDSIRARDMWNDANKTRRNIRDALGGGLFDVFETLQED